jgi:hypothetical protein
VGRKFKLLRDPFTYFIRWMRRTNQRQVDWWARKIAKDIGLETAEEVLRYEENLIKQRIIIPREEWQGSPMITWLAIGGNGHRLTPLGRKFAETLLAGS